MDSNKQQISKIKKVKTRKTTKIKQHT